MSAVQYMVCFCYDPDLTLDGPRSLTVTTPSQSIRKQTCHYLLQHVTGTAMRRVTIQVSYMNASSNLATAGGSLPKTVRLPGCSLPQSDSPILASTCINLSVWAVLDAVHRSVVPLEHLPFLAVDPVDAHPLVTRAPGDKPVLPNRVDGRRRRRIGQTQAMNRRARLAWLRRDESDRVVVRHHQSLYLHRQFHRGDGVIERQLPRQLERAPIPPLDKPVLSRTHAGVLVEPHDALDRAIVRQTTVQDIWLGVRSPEVKYPDLLFLPAGEQKRRRGGDRDAADDVIVRERVERVSAVRVPDLSCKVRAARGGARRIPTELGAPDGALVSDERADPIARPLAQHRVPVFAARYEQVSAVV